jgi:hypothetical protein
MVAVQLAGSGIAVPSSVNNVPLANRLITAGCVAEPVATACFSHAVSVTLKAGEATEAAEKQLLEKPAVKKKLGGKGNVYS